MKGWLCTISFVLADSTYTRTHRAQPEPIEIAIEGMSIKNIKL